MTLPVSGVHSLLQTSLGDFSLSKATRSNVRYPPIADIRSDAIRLSERLAQAGSLCGRIAGNSLLVARATGRSSTHHPLTHKLPLDHCQRPNIERYVAYHRAQEAAGEVENATKYCADRENECEYAA